MQISMLTGLAVPAADSTLRVTDSAWLVPRMGHGHGDFLFPTETPTETVGRVLCGIHLNHDDYVAGVIARYFLAMCLTKFNSLLGPSGLSWV